MGHNSNQSNSMWKHCTKLETIVLHLFSVLAVPVEICCFGRKIVRPRNVVICSRGKTELPEKSPVLPHFNGFASFGAKNCSLSGFLAVFKQGKEMEKCRHFSGKHNTSFNKIANLWIALCVIQLLLFAPLYFSHLFILFILLHFFLFIGDNFNVVLSNQLEQTMCEQ